ncbi:hypothetical protein [Geomesophilobacter sediminis]|uniref:Uncharacterized protein n=1 Tax=Geomesophilobacter sediminis TaxID=2798584 RepID=A0A8J7LUC4_9BACT|nr:hypothetical protein [Geomesophilobacter sediminis]MBJ6724484.1 hypothetical protein [Geomesophilobacter sediminis]
MNLILMLPMMFCLASVLMALCYQLVEKCEKLSEQAVTVIFFCAGAIVLAFSL